MADATRQLDIVISAKDEASQRIKGVGSSFKSLIDDAKVGSAIITGAMALVAKSAIEMGSNFEQSRISFETMLGSGEAAGKLLKEISDFAVKTPFDFPQVVEGTKQLLAMGSSADEVIGELKSLGDVSAGLNVPMSRLILNFGQVRTQGKLTGRELRDFNVAGVPLIDTLVKLGNEGKLSAGAFETIGGAAKGTGKKIDDLSFSIKTQTRRLDEMKDKGKEGTASYKNLADTIERNKDKLGGLTASTETYTQKITYTKDKIAEMVSDGLIKFEDVQLAFEAMTGEGGRFFDLMDRQSKTFGGIVSNIRDEFMRFALAVIGFTEEGEIRQGSIFYYLRLGAEKFLEVMSAVRPFVQSLVDNFLGNIPAMAAGIGILVGLMLPLVVAFASMIIPALQLAFWFGAIGLAVGTLIQAYVGQVGLENAINTVKGAMEDTYNFIQSKLIPIKEWLTNKINELKDRIGGKGGLKENIYSLLESWKKIWEFAEKALIPTWEFMIWRIQTMMERVKKLNIDWDALGSAWKFIATVVLVALIGFVEGLMIVISAMATIIEYVVIPAIEFWIRQITSTINAIKGLIGWLKDAYEWIRKVFSSKSAKFEVKTGGGGSYQHGGFINAPFGQAVPALLHGGERVVPRTGVDVNQGGGIGQVSINFTGPVSMDSDARVQDLAQRIIDLLGRQNELASKGLAI